MGEWDTVMMVQSGHRWTSPGTYSFESEDDDVGGEDISWVSCCTIARKGERWRYEEDETLRTMLLYILKDAKWKGGGL